MTTNNKGKDTITMRTSKPKYNKQFKTQLERNKALDDCMCVDFMVNKLEIQITDLLKTVAVQRTKLRKEGYSV